MRRRYRFRLSFWVFALLAAVIALAAFSTGLNVLHWILGAMMSVLLVSGILSGGMLRRIEVHRVIAGHAVAGQPFVVRYVVRNRSRYLPVFDVHIEERPVGGRHCWESNMDVAPGWVMHVGPLQSVHGEAIFLPRVRGEVELGEVSYWTEFPFGLVRRSVLIRQPRHLVVYPRVLPLRPDVLRRLTPSGPVGTRSGRMSGPGDDFFGLREYREGEDYRHVAWKQTANRENLLIIERAMPSPPRLRIVLDLRLVAGHESSRAEQSELEERAIILAASIVSAADAQGFEVGLTILGTGLAPIPVRRTLRHRDRLMGALAAIDLHADRTVRTQGAGLKGSVRDAVGLVIVAPDRIDPGFAGGDAVLLSATRLDQITVSETAEVQKA